MLKAKTYLLVAVLLLLLAGCESRSDSRLQPIFAQAEQLMEQHADSARSLLEKVHPLVGSAGRATQMRYYLLCTEADDKCMVVHTSDSLATLVAAYFSSHGTPMERMRAYYMLGRVHNDMQFTGDAIDDFKQALEVKGAPNDTATYRLRARANNWIGQTLMYQDMYKEALPYFFKSYNDALLSGTESVIVYSLRDIGRSLCAQGIIRKGVNYYSEAEIAANKYGLNYIRNQINSELIQYYTMAGMSLEAKKAMNKIKGFSKKEEKGTYLLNCAIYYEKYGTADSAIYCYKKCLEIQSSIYDCYKAAYSLYELHKTNKKSFPESLFYLKKSLDIADSINVLSSISNSNLVKNLKNKIVIEKRNKELQKETFRAYMILFSLGILTILLLFVIIRYIRNRKKINKRFKLILIRQKQYFIDQSRKIEKDYISKQKLIKRKIKLDEQKEKTDKLKAINEFKNSDFFSNYSKRLSVEKHNEQPFDFFLLETKVDSLLPDFRLNLKKKNPNLSQNDLDLCYLVLLDFHTLTIASLTGASSHNVSMRKKRLYTKITGKEGSVRDLKDTILELI